MCIGPSSHEGQDPREISLCDLQAFTFLPDGDLVFDDDDRLWRVHGDRIFLFAGNGEIVPSSIGDGGPATEAGLEDVRDLVTGPDGSVYIAEGLVGRVRKVSPNGRISSFAQHLAGADDLLFDDTGDLFVTSSLGGFTKIAPGGSATTLVPGLIDCFGSCDGLVLILFSNEEDVALDAQGKLYVSVNVKGYENVLRVEVKPTVET
jgi:hypothetical protein